MAEFTVDDILAEFQGTQGTDPSQGEFTVDDILAEMQPEQAGLPGVPSEQFLPPSQTQEEVRDPSLGTGEFIGGTVGSIVGGKSPASVPLAGLGAAGGEAIEQITEHIRGVPTAPKTSKEALGRIGTAAARGTMGELIGREALKLGGGAFRFIKKRPEVSGEASRAIKFLEESLPAQERGRLNPNRYLQGKEYAHKLTLLPAEATESRMLDILHNASESSLLGGEAVSKFKKNRLQSLADIANDMVDDFGAKAEPDMIGELFVQSINKNIKLSRTPAKIIYNTVDNMAGDTRVQLKGVQDFVKPLVAQAEELGGIGGASAGDKMIKDISALGTDIDFSTAKELRSRLRGISDEFSITNPKAKAIGRAKKLVQILDESMEKSLKRSGQDEALRLWRGADKIYKQGSEEFDNKFIRRLLKKGEEEPELLVKSILKDKAVSNIRRAKTALGGPNTPEWKQLQSYFIQDVMDKAKNKTTGELVGSRLSDSLNKMGKQSLREIYTPGQLNKLQEFANALSVVQGKQAEGTGKMFIQLSQAGAVVSLPSAGLTSGAASILLGPGVLSKIFTSPTLANTLIRGVKTGTKSKIAAGAMGRFLTDVTQMQEAGGFGVPEEGSVQ